MTLTPGFELGPYEIVALILTGRMGEVYPARDTRLERIVAIKVLPSAVSFDPERKRRLEREARIIPAFSYPNICQLYDVGSHNSLDYLVMEYLEGGTLQSICLSALPKSDC
jgi:eukaryotic-like serine/threonine-protein kinase